MNSQPRRLRYPIRLRPSAATGISGELAGEPPALLGGALRLLTSAATSGACLRAQIAPLLLLLLLSLPFRAVAVPPKELPLPPGGTPRGLPELSKVYQIEGMKWHADLDPALALAAKHNQPVLVYFTMPNCAWCRRLEGEVLQDPEVRKRLASFVLVKLDLTVDEKSAARFRVRSTPTLLLLSPEGRQTVKLEGYVERAELLTVLLGALGNQALKPDARIEGLLDALRAQKLPAADWPGLLLAMTDERYRATIVELVTQLNPPPRTELVEQLQHPFLAARLGALELLEELAGDDFAFNPWLDTPTPQTEAVARWRAWVTKPADVPAAQRFHTLTADEVAGYLRDLLADDADRAARARRMLQRGGASALTGLNDFLAANAGLPAGTLNKLREIRYSLLLPPLHGVEAASLAHRLVFGNLDVRLRTLREAAAARKRAVPVLKDFLGDSEPLVRETAVDALVTAGGRAVVPLLEQHLAREADANVIFLTLKQLGNLPSKRGLAVLTTYLAHANEDFVVIALESVGRLKSDTVGPQVEKCLADPRWRVRVAALKAAQTLQLKTLAARITTLLQDPDAFVRGAAVETLATVAAKDSAPQLEALFLKDDTLKGPIIRALSAADLPLSPTLLDSLKDQPPSVWLGILQRLESADLKLAPLLESAARHPDADVACAALRLIVATGLKDSPFQKAAAEQVRAGERRRVLTVLEHTELEDKVLFRFNPDARKVDLESAAGASAPAPKTAQQQELDALFGAFEKTAVAATANAPATATNAVKPAASAVDDIFQAFNTQPGSSLDFFAEFLAAGRKALAQSADRELQLAGATFLSHLGGVAAVPPLLAGLAQLTEDRRARIAHHLGRIRRKEAVPLIRRLLADPTVEVRQMAAHALLADGANDQCVEILFAELVRAGAVLQPQEVHDAVHELAGRRGSGTLLARKILEILQRPADEKLATFALIAAVGAWNAEIKAAVQPFFTSQNPWQRRAAFYAFGRNEAEDFERRLATPAQDSSESVRAVIPALYRGDQSYEARWVHHYDAQKTAESHDYNRSGRERGAALAPAAKAVLRKLATDPADNVRFQALFSLLTFQEPVDLSELTAVLERLPRDSALLEQMTDYIASHYQSLGKNFAIVLPYLNLSGRYRGPEQARAIQTHFGVDEEAEETVAALGPARARTRVEASFLPGAPRPPATTQNLRLVYFFKPGCGVCEQARKRLEQLRELFPELVLTEYDISKTAALLFNETLSEKFGVPANVRLVAPAVFGGAGYLLKEDITLERLGSLLSRSGTVPVADWLVAPPQELAAAQGNIAKRYEQAGLGIILAAGFLDGINPCAFATIIFLLSYLQVTRKTSRAIAQIGIAYILGVFATYFLIGLGLLKVATSLTHLRGIGTAVNYVMAGFALVIMALSVRDGIYCLRGQMADITLQLPDLLKQQIHRVIRTGVRQAHFVLMAFLMGVAISVLELACTGQVYLPTITYMIQQGEAGAVARLLLYNLAFIVPLTAIFVLAHSGLRSETLLAVLRRHAALVKFGTAALFFALFLLLVWGRNF